MICKQQLIVLLLSFTIAISLARFEKGPSYLINKGRKINDVFESDLLTVVNSIFSSLSERLENLQERLEKVELNAKGIADRLNHMDCYDLKVSNPLTESGIYTFHLDYKGKRPVRVYCDMTTSGGGWTVIQQRLPRNENTTTHATNFNRGFHEYQIGFGEPNRDYWLGLENIYLLTNSRQYELRVELGDFEMKEAHAIYDFYIDSESQGYIIHVSNYRGDAGDALSNGQGFDNFTADGMMFTTFDNDRDTSEEINCAKFWGIGGWWYNRCSWANLNGPYHLKQKDNCTGINWHKWHNNECLRFARMKIRPRKT